MQTTADISKILKTFQSDLTFIFDVLPESLFGFVSYSVLQAVENVVSFTKNHSYREQGNTAMCNYVETFQDHHGYNMIQNYLTEYLSCRKQECVAPLQSVIVRKCEFPQPHSVIFFLIFSIFSMISTISRGKFFRADPKKSLFDYI